MQLSAWPVRTCAPVLQYKLNVGIGVEVPEVSDTLLNGSSDRRQDFGRSTCEEVSTYLSMLISQIVKPKDGLRCTPRLWCIDDFADLCGGAQKFQNMGVWVADLLQRLVDKYKHFSIV